MTIVPGDDLVSNAAEAPAATTFCIRAGRHPISQTIPVQSGDQFIGEAGTILTGNDSTRFALHGEAENVLVRNVVVEDFAGSAGIEGEAPGVIQALTAWTLDGVVVRDNGGRGLSTKGDNNVVTDSKFLNNDRAGVGGRGDGHLYERVEWAGNGSPEYVGCCAAGIKQIGNNITIRDSYAHDNVGNGIWCDIGCNNLTVENTYSVHNSKKGIFFEISHGAVIRNNLIQDNGWDSDAFDAGMTVVDSVNVDIYGNTITNNSQNIRVESGGRLPGVHNVMIRSNTIAGGGLIAEVKTDSVQWIDNLYCQPTSTGRYFVTIEGQVPWEQWRAAGNDIGGAQTICHRQ